MKNDGNLEEEARRRFRAAQNNAQGRYFEEAIERGCRYYQENWLAEIAKTPEGFRVTKKLGGGRFEGRFVGKAQVDFQGTLACGRYGRGQSVLFDAKFTQKDKIEQGALTETQTSELERHWSIGAFCGVAVGLGGGAYFVPWEVWRSMKENFGHRYMSEGELRPFQVRYIGGTVYFLDGLV